MAVRRAVATVGNGEKIVGHMHIDMSNICSITLAQVYCLHVVKDLTYVLNLGMCDEIRTRGRTLLFDILIKVNRKENNTIIIQFRNYSVKIFKTP